MTDNNEAEGLSIEDLAAKMLGLESDDQTQEYYEEDDEGSDQPVGHPAWQSILSQIPEELHDKVIPTLQEWDAGVSRRFQKIHDEYADFKEFEDIDPEQIKEALGVYQALTNDPAATWEAIGRVYGLSPQQVSQIASENEDFDMDDIPDFLRDRLARLDEHDKVLELMSKEMLDRQAAEQEAEEDEALDEYLEELHEEYGDFDDDFVIGLLASGMDGDDAVARFQEMTQRYQPQPQQQYSAPKVMSSGGGIPNVNAVDPSKLSSQDTQALVAELLRLSNNS